MKNKKGFTLVEMLVVIALIGVVIAIAIPSITLVRKRINIRLLNEKKDEILVAAQLYGSDKKFEQDTIIKVYELLDEKYIKKDTDSGSNGCTGENTSKGCVSDPTDSTRDSGLNNEEILIKVTGNGVIAIWKSDNNVTNVDPKELVPIIKKMLDCTDENKKVENGKCVYSLEEDGQKEDDPNNYLYYSGIMWRVLGVYKIDGKEVAKMISDDGVTWEVGC